MRHFEILSESKMVFRPAKFQFYQRNAFIVFLQDIFCHFIKILVLRYSVFESILIASRLCYEPGHNLFE